MNLARNASWRRPTPVLPNVAPAWFASVMGTGILAICVVASPVAVPFGRTCGIVLWAGDVALFTFLAALWIASLVRTPRALGAIVCDPVRAQTLGAPPMACLTIAVGFLKVGTFVLPLATCIVAAQASFAVGVVGALASAFVVPYMMFTRHELASERMSGGWLLPIVPPIVASVPAALLSQTWPVALRGDLLALAYGLLGVGMALAAIVIVLFYSRLTIHNVPEGALVTSAWLVVGPLGQSIAGMLALGTAAQTVWPAFGRGLALAGLAYGLLAWGFAMYWLAMALALTVRAWRAGLPFDVSWWAFTFPVGVLIAGTDALYARTHADVFAFASLALLALLATTWSLVAYRTLRA